MLRITSGDPHFFHKRNWKTQGHICVYICILNHGDGNESLLCVWKIHCQRFKYIQILNLSTLFGQPQENTCIFGSAHLKNRLNDIATELAQDVAALAEDVTALAQDVATLAQDVTTLAQCHSTCSRCCNIGSRCHNLGSRCHNSQLKMSQRWHQDHPCCYSKHHFCLQRSQLIQACSWASFLTRLYVSLAPFKAH